MATKGGKGFMIAIRPHSFSNDYEVKPTIMEWGAWRAWYKSKGLSTALMDQRGYLMVPARWPFEFDADALEGAVRGNANMFFDAHVEAQRNAKHHHDMPEELRREVIRKARERPYTEPPYPPANFPFGKKPMSLDRPTHPPVAGTVFYDETGSIIPPPVEKRVGRSTFHRLS